MTVAAMNVPRLWQQGLYMTERLYCHRRLLWHQIKQELLEQHAGQMLGAAWPIVHPLFLMAVYTFIFSVVFVNRIGGTYDLPLDYTAYIMSGLIPWLAIQFALNKATTALTSNAGLIKQVVFPIEVPAASTGETQSCPTWAIAEARPRKRFLFNITNNDILSYLENYRFGGRIVIIIHPEYVSSSDGWPR